VYDSKLIGPQPFGSQTVGGSTASLQSWIDGADQGQTISATAAGGANACNVQIDGLPCGYGTGTIPDGANESPYGDYDTSIFAVTNNLGVAPLLAVGSITTPTTTYVRRTGSGPSGLVRGTVSWTLPEIRLGGVLSAMDPPHNNWEGYWMRLSGFTATALAESGPGAAAPSLTIGGQIRYWRNNQYQTFTVNQNGGALNISNVSYRDNSVGPDSDRVDIDMAGTVTVERSSTTRALNAGATTEATANVASPLVTQFTYRIIRNDVTQLDVTVTFNAGRARVSTSYKPVAT
jgi:hypothetical protein